MGVSQGWVCYGVDPSLLCTGGSCEGERNWWWVTMGGGAVLLYLSYKCWGLSAPPPLCCGSARGRVTPAAHLSPWRRLSRCSPVLSLCQHWCWSSSAHWSCRKCLFLPGWLHGGDLSSWLIQFCGTAPLVSLLSLVFVYRRIEAWVFKRPTGIKYLCLFENLSCFSKPHWKESNFHC